jgi:hypothetical protein
MTQALHWDFPVKLSPTGDPVMVEQDSIDHVAAQVDVALRTHPGEGTPLRPKWGTPRLLFVEQPVDVDEVTDAVRELLPGSVNHVEQLPLLVEAGLARLNVYVSPGG